MPRTNRAASAAVREKNARVMQEQCCGGNTWDERSLTGLHTNKSITNAQLNQDHFFEDQQ
jgi:hypothetical protein